MSSLHSSESLGSVAMPSRSHAFNESAGLESRTPLPAEHLSSITDLDETIKSPLSSKQAPKQAAPAPPRHLHVAREVIERYDEGVFDDGTASQTEEDENNSVVIADSDDEDEIEHFDSNDSIIGTMKTAQSTSRSRNQTNLDYANQPPAEVQSVNLSRISRMSMELSCRATRPFFSRRVRGRSL